MTMNYNQFWRWSSYITRKIAGHSCHAFSGKCPETHNLTRFTKSKGRKSTDRDHNLISSEGGHDTSTCQISGHSLHAFSGICRETSSDGRTGGQTDGHAAKRSRLVGWTNGPMYRWKEGISGFGRTDGQSENIMPPAPKGGGIKINKNVTRVDNLTMWYEDKYRDDNASEL